MEVATKAGIDTRPLWYAMGIRSLEKSDYKEARNQLAHCLTSLQIERGGSSSSSNSNSGSNLHLRGSTSTLTKDSQQPMSKYLAGVINTLETKRTQCSLVSLVMIHLCTILNEYHLLLLQITALIQCTKDVNSLLNEPERVSDLDDFN